MNIIYVKKRRKPGYNFPSLTASGDQFEAYVSALAAYTADNSTVDVYNGYNNQNATPTNLYVSGETFNGSYQFASAAVNPAGVVAYAPKAANKFMFRDTQDSDAMSVTDHGDYTLSSSTHWGSTTYRFGTVVWHNAAEVWCYLPDYYAYGTWYDGSNWGDLTFSNQTLRRYGGSFNFDGCVYGWTITGGNGNRNLCRIDSDLNVSYTTMTGITLSNPLLNLALGPNGKALHFGLDEIREIDLTNFVNGSWSPTSTQIVARGTNSWYEAAGGLAKPILCPDGCFYVFPNYRLYDANTHNEDKTYAIKYDPSDESVTQIDYENTNVSLGASYVNSNTSYQISKIRARSSNGNINTGLMPDGRIAICSNYACEIYRPSFSAWSEDYGPFAWNPTTGVFDQNSRLPWGSYISQWGLTQGITMMPSGKMGQVPTRMAYNSGTNQTAWTSDFFSIPDVAPPIELVCSGYL